MSVQKRGESYHYRFQVEGKRYHGVCVDCTSKRQALDYESKIKSEVSTIRSQRNVVALVENYRRELTGSTDIPLCDALKRAEAKPSKRKPQKERVAVKLAYWQDFVAFMRDKYPDVKHLAAVRRQHCESYVSHLTQHGRFTVKNGLQLSSKTIKEIVAVCRGVFTRLQEDAGIIHSPFNGIELPVGDSVSRDIFTQEELQLIKEGIADDDFCRPLFTVAALTGLTEGDICTLKWSELQCNYDGQLYIRRLRRKTQVALEIPVMPALRAYLSDQPRLDENIFPEHAALYLKSSTVVSKRIIRFLRGQGIETRKQIDGRRAVSVKDLHSMRHVFCYYAGMAGIPFETVQSIVGHLTPEMTRHYMAHVTLRDKTEAMRKLPTFLTLVEPSVPLLQVTSPRERLLSIVQEMPDTEVDRLLQQLCG